MRWHSAQAVGSHFGETGRCWDGVGEKSLPAMSSSMPGAAVVSAQPTGALRLCTALLLQNIWEVEKDGDGSGCLWQRILS